MAKSKKECPEPAGVLLVIGGKENKGEEPEKRQKPSNFIRLEILQCFLNIIKKNNPLIEIVTSASSEGEESFQEYKKLFQELDSDNVRHLHHVTRKEAMEESVAERMREADAVFFSGGDQLLLTSLYGGTPMLTALKERFIYEPIVVAGTSAGAMALSTPMIYAGNKEVQQIGGLIKVTTGLEFLKDVCVDTHFVDRGRFVRMAQVIATNPNCIGLGIEEDTALIVRKGLEAEVVGSGIVIVIEGFSIEDSSMHDFTEEKPLSIRNLAVHLLGKGQTYTIPKVNPRHA